jgi:predicted RNA methylase
MDVPRLLGDFDWEILDCPKGLKAYGRLERKDAACVQARLRGLGFNGHPLQVDLEPKLPRLAVREARTLEARARRDTTAGFEQSQVRMDEEGRFSLTPSALALTIGEAAESKTIVDAGCGVGGNSIGFARAGCRVIAVDNSELRLAHAKHNASVYSVDSQIEFVCGDVIEILPSLHADILFVDPPWGLDYNRKSTSLSDLPLLDSLLNCACSIPNIWLKLPPSFALQSLPCPVSCAQAMFGRAPGDRHRVKFVWVQLETHCRL